MRWRKCSFNCNRHYTRAMWLPTFLVLWRVRGCAALIKVYPFILSGTLYDDISAKPSYPCRKLIMLSSSAPVLVPIEWHVHPPTAHLLSRKQIFFCKMAWSRQPGAATWKRTVVASFFCAIGTLHSHAWTGQGFDVTWVLQLLRFEEMAGSGLRAPSEGIPTWHLAVWSGGAPLQRCDDGAVRVLSGLARRRDSLRPVWLRRAAVVWIFQERRRTARARRESRASRPVFQSIVITGSVLYLKCLPTGMG